MIRIPVDIPHHLPISRETAAKIARAASGFESTVTLEGEGLVLNLKSMIGLLSQSIPKDGNVLLVISGPDEEQAKKQLTQLLLSLFPEVRKDC